VKEKRKRLFLGVYAYIVVNSNIRTSNE